MSNTTIVTSTHVPGILTDDELHAVKEYQDSNKEFLNIPRRQGETILSFRVNLTTQLVFYKIFMHATLFINIAK